LTGAPVVFVCLGEVIFFSEGPVTFLAEMGDLASNVESF